MPRTVDITVPADQSDPLRDALADLPGLLSVRLQRGVSLQPPGDVLALEATIAGVAELMRRLDARGLTTRPDVSFRISEPTAIVSSTHWRHIARDDSEATWEEMDFALARSSNMTLNGLGSMLLAGFIAAVGINTNALHLVIGAMVIAPGFAPLTRIALGATTGSRNSLWRGLLDTGRGYAALVVGAAVAGLVLRALGEATPGGDGSYFQKETLVSYWTQPTYQSFLVSAAAAIAGAILIAAHRTVLTGGVMIALALIPSGTLIGMALVWTDGALAGRAAVRLLIEMGLVVSLSALVLLWKRLRSHRRPLPL